MRLIFIIKLLYNTYQIKSLISPNDFKAGNPLLKLGSLLYNAFISGYKHVSRTNKPGYHKNGSKRKILIVNSSRLRNLKKRQGLSAKELIQKSELSESSIHSYLASDVNISINSLKKLAKALNVPVNTLVSNKRKNWYRSIEDQIDEICIEREESLDTEKNSRLIEKAIEFGHYLHYDEQLENEDEDSELSTSEEQSGSMERRQPGNMESLGYQRVFCPAST